MDIRELKSLLSRYHIRPDKSLGQNFLLSEKVLDEIITAAELKPTDTVLEIGAGLGILTKALAEKAGQVIAIEKDRKLAHALRKMFTPLSSPLGKGGKRGVVKIINEDALFFDFSNFQLPTSNFKIVANIPYYITGKLLQNFLSPSYSPPHEGELEGVMTSPSPQTSLPLASTLRGTLPSSGESNSVRTIKPSLIVLLLQKEVAERIVAGPGEMSLLSVSVQFYADAEIISYVGKENFYPVPEVDSAVVKITPLSSPLGKGGKRGVRFDVDEKSFFQLIKMGFSNKRKQLQNNLQSLNWEAGSMKHNYKLILEELGLNPLCRAQDLSLEDWYRLYQALEPV